MAFGDDGYFLQHNGHKRLVVPVSLDASNGLDDLNAGLIALSKYGVVLIQRVVALLCDEELAAIRVRSGVGHRQPARDVEVQVRIEFVGEGVSWIAASLCRLGRRPES